jgi:hypothetical protein
VSDLKLQEEINKGQEADRILNNPVYKEAIESVRKGIVDAMASSPMGDDKTHNRLVIALQLVNQIDRNLKSYMQTGQMAKIQASGGAVQKIRGIA